jgi:hypothetical protein
MEWGILIFDNKELLSDYFFEYGRGPAGLLDLMRHLKENTKRTNMICAQFIDVVSNTWAYSREITGRSTLLNYVKRVVEEANVVVFQNFLNEYNPIVMAAAAINV